MCKHMEFSAQVNVLRLEDSGIFNCDITIKCVECGEPFSFIGLPSGVDLEGAMVSIDDTEARLAIVPGRQPLAQRSTYNLRPIGKRN